VLGQCLTQDSHGWIVGLFDIQSLHGLLKTLTVGFRTYDVLLGTSTVVTWILMMLFRNPLFACRVFFRNPIRAAQCDGMMSTFVVLPYTCSGKPRRHTRRCTLGSWRHSRVKCMTVGSCRCAQMMSCLDSVCLIHDAHGLIQDICGLIQDR
jgi:hypothetical protein